MTTPIETQPAAVTCRGLSRTFGSTRALSGVDLDVAPGTIHALVGQNGAGKSTCLGIIAGRIRPTDGEVNILGRPFAHGTPRAAQTAGVAAVYQELTVIGHLTPQANVFLGRPITRGGLLRRGVMRRQYEQLCAEVGIPCAPDVPCGALTVAQQQLIEIVRAVAVDARVLVLDEPTAALALGERQALFRTLHSLKAKGTSIVLVSHNLDEVLENSDEITVFRDGNCVATRPAAQWTKPDLINSMLGDASRELREAEAAVLDDADRPAHAKAAATASNDAPVLLRAHGVRLAGRLRDVDLELRSGEVVGVAGLMGSGRSSLLRALAGAEAGTRGQLTVDGRTVRWPSTPRAAQALGIAFLPEDRKTQGLCLDMSAADNVALPRLGLVSRLGYLAPRRAANRMSPFLRSAGVDLAKIKHPARSLSGGNQQKLLFARMSFLQPRVLLADEPTRGIDIGAKADILDGLRRLAHEDGVAVVLVSSDLEEVLAFSDRVVVMAGGQLVTEFGAGEASEDDVLRHAFGVETLSSPDDRERRRREVPA